MGLTPESELVMRDDLKIDVFNEMVDPEFKWTRGSQRLTTGERCGVGVIVSKAMEAGVEVNWKALFPGTYFGPNTLHQVADDQDAVRAWADMTFNEWCDIESFNDFKAQTPADVAEFIKNLPS